LEIVHAFVEKLVQKLNEIDNKEAVLYAPDMSSDEEGDDYKGVAQFLETVLFFSCT